MEARPCAAPAAVDGQDPVPTSTELDEVEADLAGVEQALARLDDGTYGMCERCGLRLDGELLRQRPTASRCDVCA